MDFATSRDSLSQRGGRRGQATSAVRIRDDGPLAYDGSIAQLHVMPPQTTVYHPQGFPQHHTPSPAPINLAYGQARIQPKGTKVLPASSPAIRAAVKPVASGRKATDPSTAQATKKIPSSTTKAATSPRSARGTARSPPRAPADLTAPALPGVLPPIVSDPDQEVMVAGLRRQHQDWAERTPLRKLVSGSASLVRCIQGMCRSGVLVDVPEVREQGLAKAVDGLGRELHSRLQVLYSIDGSLRTYADQLSEKHDELQRLHQTDLKRAAATLVRAKRKRRYNEEFEALAKEILGKKRRSICARELEEEKSKLDVVMKEVELWKEIGELRKRQAAIALSNVRAVLEGARQPEKALELLRHCRSVAEEQPEGFDIPETE